MNDSCILCNTIIDTQSDTFVTFSRDGKKSKCSHLAHLICSLRKERYNCIICNPDTEDVDFGLKKSDGRMAALTIMQEQLRSVEENENIFSKWLGSNDGNGKNIRKCLAKFPLETLQKNTLLQFIDAGIRISDLLNFLNPCDLHKFTSADILQLQPTSNDLCILMKDGEYAFSHRALSRLCNTIQDLKNLRLTATEYYEIGFDLDQWIGRGASLGDILEIHTDSVSFSEFISTWNPSIRNLIQLQCFKEDFLRKHTPWNVSTVQSYAVSKGYLYDEPTNDAARKQVGNAGKRVKARPQHAALLGSQETTRRTSVKSQHTAVVKPRTSNKFKLDFDPKKYRSNAQKARKVKLSF